MFGRNEPRGRTHGDILQYHAVFYTIQGEGPYSGDPAAFIRLTGCNLRCWFCDTEWGDESDPHAKAEEIARIAMNQADGRTDLAVITGGEPTRQDLGELFHWLMRYGFKRIQVETAGTFWQDCLDWPGVTLVVSPKTSKVHEEYRKRLVNWKYVLKAGEVDPDDGLPSAPMQRHRDGNTLVGGAPARPNRGDPVFLQPVDEHLGSHEHNANLGAVRDSALRFGYRAGLQVHKFLGVD